MLTEINKGVISLWFFNLFMNVVVKGLIKKKMWNSVSLRDKGGTEHIGNKTILNDCTL